MDLNKSKFNFLRLVFKGCGQRKGTILRNFPNFGKLYILVVVSRRFLSNYPIKIAHLNSLIRYLDSNDTILVLNKENILPLYSYDWSIRAILFDQQEEGKQGCKQTHWRTIIDILSTNDQLMSLFTSFLPVFLLVN